MQNVLIDSLAGWLTGWTLRFQTCKDLETSVFFAIDSVDHGGWTIQKNFGPGPLWVPVLYNFNNMGVDLECFWGEEFEYDEIFKIRPTLVPDNYISY
jgi:hypothetical protein